MRGINNDQSPDASLKERFEKGTGRAVGRGVGGADSKGKGRSSRELQEARLRRCEANGPQSAGERVDVEELRQVERSGVRDVLEGENKTL